MQTDTTAQGVGLITASGRLDAAGQAQLISAARLAMTNAYVLVLDLRGLTHCDTAGVRAVLEIDALARAADSLLVIRSADDTVHCTFQESGVADRLRFIGPGTAASRRPGQPAEDELQIELRDDRQVDDQP